MPNFLKSLCTLSLNRLLITTVITLPVLFLVADLANAQTPKFWQDKNYKITYRATEVDPDTCEFFGDWAKASPGAAGEMLFPAGSVGPGTYTLGYRCRSLPSSSQGGNMISTQLTATMQPSTVKVGFGGSNPFWVNPNLTFTTNRSSVSYRGQYTITWNFTGSPANNGGTCTLSGTNNASNLTPSGSRTITSLFNLCQEIDSAFYRISCIGPGMSGPLTSSFTVDHRGNFGGNCVPL